MTDRAPDSLPGPDRSLTDRDYLRRLDLLARRRVRTRIGRDQAIATLLAQATTEDALLYLGLDLDELRRQP